jgi:hypothetical protein
MIPAVLSLDAHVMFHPSRAFRDAPAGEPATLWTAARRPLFVAFALASTVSLATAGAVTLRIVGPAMGYWLLVPLVELAALTAAVGSRWRRLPAPAVIDRYFAGHGPWLLVLIGVGLTIPVLDPAQLWTVLTVLAIAAVPLVLAWSAWIDVCFFRDVIGAGRGRAIGDAILVRLITWPLVFGLFAVPGMMPSSIVHEVAAAVMEISR